MAGRSSLLGSRLAEDKIVLDYISGPLGLSLFVLGHFFLLDVDFGLSIKWGGVVRFFGPTYIYIYIYIYTHTHTHTSYRLVRCTIL